MQQQKQQVNNTEVYGWRFLLKVIVKLIIVKFKDGELKWDKYEMPLTRVR